MLKIDSEKTTQQISKIYEKTTQQISKIYEKTTQQISEICEKVVRQIFWKRGLVKNLQISKKLGCVFEKSSVSKSCT